METIFIINAVAPTGNCTWHIEGAWQHFVLKTGSLWYDTTAGSLKVYTGSEWITVAGDDAPAAHKTSHQDAGADEISVTGLSGVLADGQPVVVQKGGVAVGTRPILNFIEGTGTTLTITDANGKINITVAVGV